MKKRWSPQNLSWLLAALVSLPAWTGCGKVGDTTPVLPAAQSDSAASKAAADESGTRFAEVTKAAGIDYHWTVQGKRPLTILQTIGNGCAFLDYDNDGNLDILLVGPKPALYKGDGKGHFTDVTHATGLDKLSGHFLGCAVGDYDNDGYSDIYISAYRGGLLLHNEKGKTFTDVTKQAGIASQPWGTSCTFTDFDGDGKLDLYIGNYVQFGPETQPQLCDNSGIMSSCGPKYYLPLNGAMYRNLGGGKFQDVTKVWDLKVTGKALGVAAADIAQNGRPTLAIANDEMEGDLLERQGQKYHNVAESAGIAFDNNAKVHGGMGLDWGDYDNDGKLDLAVATFEHEVKNVYRNEGGGLFTDNATMLGIAEATMPNVAFGCKFLDADNDGWLDLMFANGHVQDNIAEIDKGVNYKESTQIFRNLQGRKFQDISATAGPAFQAKIVGRGLAVGDFDNDGKMDALVVDSEGAPILLHNETPKVGHWLLVKLIGVKSNRDGIGALVTAQAGERKLLRRCASDGSYMSSSDKRVHFGLGDATTVTLTVHWPSGQTNFYGNIKADRIVTLKEGESNPH